jgi:thiol-disulfide isomerase/thioredoxin
MARLSILAASILAAALAGSGRAGTEDGNERSIILFGARWCAPCMAEYQNLPSLASAGAPERLVLAWVDRKIAAPVAPALAPTIRSLSVAEARRLAHQIAGDGYGLPFSAMLDKAGKVCAIWRSPLHAVDFATIRTQCSRPQP